ncbi:hypothetical protein C8R45DRAFT_1103609 [Mycena sanguinolenta]|nr:hypothetical protein C8R45DRAFT_1103609 [Mycena sanguinolenta]
MSAEQEQEQDTFAIILLNVAQIGVITDASKQDVLHNLETVKTIMGILEHFSEAFYSEMTLAELKLREGGLLAAKDRFKKCLHWSWARDAQVSSSRLEKMADISSWGPIDYEWAATSGIIYLAFAQKMKQKLGLYKSLCSLRSIFLSNREELTAESLFTVALEAFTKMNVHHWRARCMVHLGDIAMHQGAIFKAERQWRVA